jgi:hypothetical protein
MYYVKKKDLFGCLRLEAIRYNDNETSLMEDGVIEMSTTVLPLRDARSPSLLNTYLNTSALEVK